MGSERRLERKWIPGSDLWLVHVMERVGDSGSWVEVGGAEVFSGGRLELLREMFERESFAVGCSGG